ncbi:hypothetical protein JCGZ_16355 [Jatropha curcas]|uniref:Uncharacterized protein n=2 Tax=Jatropha curcas TaxID=180498 RepID=A0A067L7X7_JATCU|nr:hypothetical protein JCGZ_16355 [Jatropha curcas]
MALTVTVNKFASSNVHAVQRRETKRSSATTTPPSSAFGRRGIFFSTLVAAYPVATDSKTELLNKYLKKSEENKTKNDKERLDSYYKRNYKDYFDYVEGSLRGKKEQDLSESEKSILDWLKNNK